MKKLNLIHLMLWGILWLPTSKIYSQTIPSKTEPAMEANKKSNSSEQVFIDRFMVPEKAKQEFLERMSISRNFIKTLPGFIEDSVYKRVDEQGNLTCITVAVWASEEAMKKARETVQAEYKREGFSLQAMLERLHITIDRGIYTKAEN